jgi:DNA polymerase II large subunit
LEAKERLEEHKEDEKEEERHERQKDEIVIVKPFYCDECGETFFLKGHLKNHRETHHTEREQQCDDCNDCNYMKG